MRKHLLLSSLLLSLIFLSSCGQNEVLTQTEETPSIVEEAGTTRHETLHPYGGWSCPDNIGFAPVNLQELDKVPVVEGRLPTKEETQNGTSLVFFDINEIPDAKALEMKMPRVARYYSEYTKKNELVVVIQAVEADNDTVVGFRYLNGGNGSSWFDEVTFLSDEEVAELGPTPFVEIHTEINAAPEKVFAVVTDPAYAKELGELLGENAYMDSDWKKDSQVRYSVSPNKILRTGTITSMWNNMYLQVDYDMEGDHFVEKYLILNNKESNTVTLNLVSGPYAGDFETREAGWKNWAEKVKELSE